MKMDPVQKILAAMLASGVSVEELAAAKAKADAANGGASKVEGASNKLLATQAQAEAAGPGKHPVKGATGLYLKKGLSGSGAWFRRY